MKNTNCFLITLLELSPGSQRDKPKDRNERGETPLHIAAKKGDPDGTKKLLDQGINPNGTDFAGKLERIQLNVPMSLNKNSFKVGLHFMKPLIMVTTMSLLCWSKQEQM